MHILGIGLHVIVAIFFAVHAIRTRQEMYWLLVLFLFPLLGSVAYALAVWLPDVRDSRGGRRALRALREQLDPGRELREAREAFEVSSTVQNRLRLADALLAARKADDALPLYADCLKGLYRDDPDISLRYARALLDAGQCAEARAALDALIASRPDFRSPEGHLLYARAVAACGDRDAARHEFDTLLGYWASLEPRAFYAETLVAWGDAAAARALAEDALRPVKHMPRHARELNAEWIQRLKAVAREP